MIRASLILGFVMVTCQISFSQDLSKCPTLQILGPPGIIAPNEIARYEAIVSPAHVRELKFQWTVSAGTIKAGQGTPTIEVIQPRTTLTATVEVIGLPEGCPETAAAASGFEIDPAFITLFEEIFGRLNSYTEKRIRAAAAKSSDYDQLFVIVVAKNSKTAERRVRRLKRVLRKEIGRVTFIESVSATDKIKVYSVPPGASPPTP